MAHAPSSSLFPFWCLDDKGGEDSNPYHFYCLSFQCVMDLSSMRGGHGGQEPIYVWLVKL
jgi:hypothetical protein